MNINDNKWVIKYLLIFIRKSESALRKAEGKSFLT
jgi:hypothetical protein